VITACIETTSGKVLLSHTVIAKCTFSTVAIHDVPCVAILDVFSTNALSKKKASCKILTTQETNTLTEKI
jgi:hypothetical protein